MKKIVLSIAAIAVIVATAFLIGREGPAGGNVKTAPKANGRAVLYYKAPMDPNYRSDQPGKSPMGMDLVPVYADEAETIDQGIVSIDPGIVNNLGVRTALAEKGALSRRIETVGYVGYDEDTIHHVHTRAEGWIEKLSIKATGDPVASGQVLFEFYSPTLVNAQEEYLATMQSSNASLRKASRQRLMALGVDESGIERLESERTVEQRVRVYARSDGFVTNLGVREGIYVTAATDVMSIAGLDSVWVLADVFERQAAWVRAGQRAEVILDYLPGEILQGSVDYVYPVLDSRTRTLKVRLRFENPAGTLRPNMFSHVTIFGTETPAVIHVPQEALIRGGAVDRVVLDLGDGRFRSQAVNAGVEAGDRVEIRSGISAGERVVTSGQFLIDSESNRESALARLTVRDDNEPPKRVVVTAIVRGINADDTSLRLEHEAIPEWSWPSMTMDFDLAEPSLLDGLEVGSPVEVTIDRHGDEHFVIANVSRNTVSGQTGHEPPAEESSRDHKHHNMEPRE